jgi:hypothetical protein
LASSSSSWSHVSDESEVDDGLKLRRRPSAKSVPCPPSLPLSFSPLSLQTTMYPITLTSQQIRILRFSAFSLGSILIFYCLVQFASNDNIPRSGSLPSSTRPPSSSHPSPGSSSSNSRLGLNGEPIGNDPDLWRESTGERRLSVNHAWIKPKEHRRVLVGSHFTAHEG